MLKRVYMHQSENGPKTVLILGHTNARSNFSLA